MCIARRLCLAVSLTVAFFAASPSPVQATAAYRAAVEQSFGQWLGQLKVDAAAKGIKPETFDAAMKGVRLDWSLPDLAPPDLGPGQPVRMGQVLGEIIG